MVEIKKMFNLLETECYDGKNTKWKMLHCDKKFSQCNEKLESSCDGTSRLIEL